MKIRYTDKEVRAILKQMGVLADTREQKWEHVRWHWKTPDAM